MYDGISGYSVKIFFKYLPSSSITNSFLFERQDFQEISMTILN